MNIKKLSLVLSLILVVLLTGCKGLTPVDPSDEVESKNHDDPKRIELILFDCHFHGRRVHATSETKGVKHLTMEQKMVLEEVPGKGWQIMPDKGVTRFVVCGGASGTPVEPVDPATRDWTDASFNPSADATLSDRSYGLLIRMYNKEGKDITGQFATNGEDKRHQFFFTAENIRPTKYGDPAMKYDDGDYRYMYYYYFDTTPWDSDMRQEGTRYTGISNPIGLKGFMQFPVINSRFELKLTLLHARSSKFSGEGGKPSPFYGLSKKQRATDVTDISLGGIPFVVFAHSEDYLESEVRDLSKLSESDRLLVDKLAEAFEITPEEALDDLWALANNPSEPHDLSKGRYL